MFEKFQVLSVPFLFSVNNNFHLLIPWDSQKPYSAFQLAYPWSLVIFPMQFEFSHSVRFNPLRTHGLQHARPHCDKQLPFIQTHVHWLGDAIQLSHLLLTPFPPVFNPSQHQVSSVQSLSCVPLFATPWTAAHQASLSITNSRSYSTLCALTQWTYIWVDSRS